MSRQDDYRDGTYPGIYRLTEGYSVWTSVRSRMADVLKTDPATTWFFFLTGHIGDYVSALSAIGAFKRHRSDPPIAVISSGPPDLALLYGHCATGFGGPYPIDLGTLLPLSRFAPGYPIIAEPHFYGDGRLLDLFPVACFMDVFRYYMRLPMGTPLAQPQVPRSAQLAAEEAFMRAGLPPGRTVLLAPHANSAPRMPIAWWAELAEHLKRRRLMPVTNVPNHFGKVKQEEPVPGTLPIDLPLAQVIPFIERAGHFIAVAQGLCDLVTYAKAKLKVIYTPCHFADGLRPEDGASSTGGYSLVRNYPPSVWDMYDLPTDAPFDPAVLEGWG